MEKRTVFLEDLAEQYRIKAEQAREKFKLAKAMQDSVDNIKAEGAGLIRSLLMELQASTLEFPDGYTLVRSTGQRGSFSEARLKEVLITRGVALSAIEEIIRDAKKITEIDNCYGRGKPSKKE